MTCSARDFHKLPWTPWVLPRKMVKGGPGPEGVPRQPGIYRIRVEGQPLMAYFGESDDLGRRLVDNWQDINMGGGKNQNVRPSYLVEVGKHIQGRYLISWTTGVGPWPYDLSDERERKCLERCLEWLCRRETGRSAFGNHARAGEGNQLISDTTSEGHPEGIQSPGPFHPSTRALRSNGRDPGHKRWMDRLWSEPASYEELRQGRTGSPEGFIATKMSLGPALYKVLDAPTGELLYVGFRKHARQDVRTRLNQLPGDPVGAWSPLRRKAMKLEAWEMVDDLLGAHYFETGQIPKCQFRIVFDS